MNKISIFELTDRHNRTQKLMQKEGIDGLLILQDIDLFYYANSMQVLAVYIPENGNALTFYRRAKEKISDDCLLDTIQIKSFIEILDHIKNSGYNSPSNLGLEYDVLPYSIYLRVIKAFPGMKTSDASGIIKSCRMLKSDYEIEMIKNAGSIINQVFNKIKSIFRYGMTELDLAREIEYLFRKFSHLGPTRMRGFNQELFYGHVLSGKNTLKPTTFDMPLGGAGTHPSFSTGAANKKIEKNEPVLIDYVCNYLGYHHDTTRTFVSGNLDKELVKNYDFLKIVFLKIKEILKPGISCEEVYNQILDFVEESGFKTNFMGYLENKVNFFGHGIGIEVDEFPVIAPKSSIIIEKNMVIACEPKMFFPSLGALGIEDTFLITENGNEVLSGLDIELMHI